MKGKCGTRNSACKFSSGYFSPSLTPRLLCSSLSPQELTSPFLSLAAEVSSHMSHSLCLSRMDGCSNKLVILDHHPHSRASPFSSVTPPLPLSSLYLFRPLIYPLPLLPSLLSPVLLLSLSVSLIWLGCRQCCGIGSSMGLEESSGTKQS